MFAKARSRSERGASATQAACDEAISLAEGMKELELIDLDESATRALSKAKKRFEDSRRKATEAFGNQALETSDRVLAMQYRVMATILETLDNPEDAITPCTNCLEELNAVPAVQSCFGVQLKKGLRRVRGLFSIDERKQIIFSVCHVNRVVYDVMETFSKVVDLLSWPTVDVGDYKVNPLLDRILKEAWFEHGIEQCCVTLSFGQGGEEEHKLKKPECITTNSSGHFIIGDRYDCTVKVFDSGGKFVKHFSVCSDVMDTEFYRLIYEVATDVNDNIYVLVGLKPGPSPCMPDPDAFVHKFENNSSLHHKFPVSGTWLGDRVIVTDSGKVLVLNRMDGVHVYENDGQWVRSFGEGVLNCKTDITATNDGRVMVLNRSGSTVHIFSEDGDLLNRFKLQGRHHYPVITFHQASENVVVASVEPDKEHLHIEIYSKDGKFVRSTDIHEEGIRRLRGITVTLEGRIALLLKNRRVIEVQRTKH